MSSLDYVKPAEGGCLLSVDVSPGASQSDIVGVNQWRGALQVRVAAPPREGAANEELVRFLASRLGIPAKGVTVVRGARSSTKTLHIKLEADKVRQLLGRD